MDIKNLLISMIIGLIVLLAVFVPVVDALVSDSKTFTNDGYYQMEVINADDEFVATYDKSNPTSIVINDEVISIDFDYNVALSLMAGTNWCLRASLYQGQMLVQFFSGSSNVSAGVDADSLTIVNNNGTLVATNSNSDTRSVEFESFYSITNDGDYVMKYSDKPVYMLDESVFVGVGLTSGSSAIGIVGLNVTGDMDDVTITPWRGTDLTFSNIVVDKTQIESYVGLNEFNDVSFTVTDGESDSLNITYSYVIVPEKVHAEKSDPLSPIIITLLSTLPIFATIGLIVGGVVYFRRV